MKNPLLENNYIVEFDKIKPEHVEPAVDFLISQTDATLAKIESISDPTWDNVMGPINELDLMFQRSFSPIPHLLSVRNSDELREVYEKIQPKIVEASLKIQQNNSIYNGLKKIKGGAEWKTLSHTRKRIIESKISDAELSGIGLKGEERKRFNEISQELSRITTKFSNNVLDSVKAWEKVVTNKSELAGLSESFLESASHSYTEATGKESSAENGPWRLTLDYPMLEPIIRDCENRSLREELYMASILKASSGNLNNEPLMIQILSLRQEKANLLGFKNYGEMSTSDKMAGNVKSVNNLLDELLTASKKAGQQEIQELKEFAKKIGHKEEVSNWDFRFLSEKLRKDKYNFSEEEVRNYFPLETVLNGMFALVEKIFGITVKEFKGESPVWHSDVKFYKLHDKEGTHVASFLFDPFSRPADKRGGAWMNECVTRQIQNGKELVPVAYIVCNFSKPTKDKPSLLTFRDVETTFHEFGHALQHMLTEITEPEASGINGVEWDAVELPSQFMENWCYHKPTVMKLSSHFKTKEPLPTELFNKLKDAKNFNAAYAMLRQLVFAKVDMLLHTEFKASGDEDVFAFYQKIANEMAPLPPHPQDKFLCSFTHIFAGGYAAGYYSYKWAEVLSADAFSAFEEVGLDNTDKIQEVGQRFRSTVLALGGSEHPMEIFKKFRGREPSTKPLLQHSGLV